MAHTKQTARKSNGGSAPRVNLKVTSTSSKRVSGDVEQGMEICKMVHHNGFCILCRDGSASFEENTLFMCNHCPRVMCRLCMQLPLGAEDMILKHGTPYYGFYNANGTTVLESFLWIHASLEVSSKAQLSAAPVIFIHLVLVDFETTASPFLFAHSFLQPYFTSGGCEYHEIAYDIISDVHAYRKAVHQTLKALKNSFVWERVVVAISTHTDNDEGDPFAGYSYDGNLKCYGGTATDDFLDIVLSPWQSLLDHGDESYLWLFCCGSIVNNSNSFAVLQRAVVRHKLSATIAFTARRFQPSFASHLLLAFTEQVVVEHCPIQLAFGDMLAQSYKLGRHTDVILLTTLEASLQISKFTWGDVETSLGAASCQSNAQTVGGLILGVRPMSGVQQTRFMSLSARIPPVFRISLSIDLKAPPCCHQVGS
ncbi:hypothetical protein EV702DRAFT_1051327 [Suillus placidus]|uniref:Uncharacterized protein n=1 Tax=Suillus placidus TaxID=48579 RepID=A0A9P6ZG02_9AGAM|nr:hypothetical protein EV702DRAFT_1051327 [Suillus placidus]